MRFMRCIYEGSKFILVDYYLIKYETRNIQIMGRLLINYQYYRPPQIPQINATPTI